MEIEVRASNLIIYRDQNKFVLVLKDLAEKYAMPILIAKAEADALAIILEKLQMPRPLTHNLAVNIMTALDTKITKVVINELKNNMFYALIYLDVGGKQITIDARPSDAIPLALLAGSPIYVESKIFEEAALPFQENPEEATQDPNLALEKMDPEKMHKA